MKSTPSAVVARPGVQPAVRCLTVDAMNEGRVRGEPREATDDSPLTRLLELWQLPGPWARRASAALLAQDLT